MKSTSTPTPSRDPGLKRLRTGTRWAAFAGLIASAVLLATIYPGGGEAATAPSLGTAQSFAVLGGTTVTNTGPTTINGDLGVSPGTAITNAGTITLAGAAHSDGPVALQAQNDVTTAYNALTSESCTQPFSGTDVEIGGQTLTPGVYCYDSSAQLTGTLTLNGNGVFIFKTVSTLTTAVGSTVALIGGAEPCNVFWQIGSSADLFTTTTFVGNILALTSINLQNGASVAGRVLARNGAVTLDTNTITATSCGLVSTATPTSTATGTQVATATATQVAATNTPVPTEASIPSNTPVLALTATQVAASTATQVTAAAATQAAAATATQVAAAATTRAAAPTSAATPAAPAGIRPPPTGDAGLLQHTESARLAAGIAFAAVFLLGAASVARLRPKRGQA